MLTQAGSQDAVTIGECQKGLIVESTGGMEKGEGGMLQFCHSARDKPEGLGLRGEQKELISRNSIVGEEGI